MSYGINIKIKIILHNFIRGQTRLYRTIPLLISGRFIFILFIFNVIFLRLQKRGTGSLIKTKML